MKQSFTANLRFVAITCVILASPPIGRAQAAALYHHISVRLSPQTASIVATDRIRIAIFERRMTFDLDPRLQVNRIIANGTTVEFEGKDGRWRVDMRAAGSYDLVIEYDGSLELAPQSSTSQPSFLGAEGSLLISNWYPRFSDGRLTYTIDASIDDGQIVVAPGRLEAEHPGDDMYRARFTSDRPAQDIPLFAGPYRIRATARGATKMRTYFHEESPDLAELYLRKAEEFLDRFEATIGPYPFSFFYVVSSPIPVGLGFPGVAYLSRQIIPLPYVPSTSLGHEILHNWWGIGVRVRDDTGNWAEGLTTFGADYAFAQESGMDAVRDIRLRWLRGYAVLPPERDSALASFRGKVHTASQVVGYHKAAFLFLMLRDLIGAQSFETALRRFWIEQRGQDAAWSDLQRAFEATSGRSLQEFFSQWIDRAGAPSLSLREARWHREKDGYRVFFTVRQQGPAYELLLPIRIETGPYQHDERILLRAPSKTFSILVRDRPLRLLVDPNLRLFRRLAPAEVPPILREVAFDTNAATILADIDKPSRAVSEHVAAKFLERAPRLIAAKEGLLHRRLLIVGSPERIRGLQTDLGLAPAPSSLPPGTARAWAARSASGKTTVIVEGERDALEMIAGPLPHYGSRSYVVFEGRRAIAKGLWPPKESPLTVELRK